MKHDLSQDSPLLVGDPQPGPTAPEPIANGAPAKEQSHIPLIAKPNKARKSKETVKLTKTNKPDWRRQKRATSGKVRSRARRAAQGIIRGNKQSDAMRQAGYSESAIHHRSSRDMELIRAETNRILDAAYPLQAMIEDLLSGLQATRFVVVPGGKTPATVIPEPDFHARHKYFQTAAQMRGLLVRDVKITGTGPNGEIELSVALSAARQRAAQADVTAQIVHELPPKPNQE